MMQTDMIMNHLLSYGSITPLEAMERYGIMRLGARIYDLRKNGVPIAVDRVKGKNRFGIETCFARYTLKGAHDGTGS